MTSFEILVNKSMTLMSFRFILCVGLCAFVVSVYHVCVGAPGGQREKLVPLELNFQEAENHPIRVLGTEPRSSA